MKLLIIIGYLGSGKTSLPQKLKKDFVDHIQKVRRRHLADRQNNLPGVALHQAMERKYTTASKE